MQIGQVFFGGGATLELETVQCIRSRMTKEGIEIDQLS
jgi:hypothetical protein